MSPPVRQHSFSSGEIAPSLYARTDLARYENGLRTCRNMMVMRHGGVTGRPGTQYVGATLNGGAAVRLIPFIFNETGLGQSYVLEFGNLYIAFIQNGGYVTVGGSPYTIVSPYAQADLATLQFAETADIVTITHKNYAVRELARLGATNWTITKITNWGSNVTAPTHSGGTIQISGTAGSDAVVLYWVSSVNAQGQESDVASPGYPFNTVGSNGLKQPSTTNPITISWDAVTGAVSYRIYRSLASGSAGLPVGYIGQTALTSFTDSGLTPDFTNVYPQYTQIFGDDATGNCPAVVGFSQQRRCFGQTINNPIGFWESKPGAYSNFDIHILSQDSDAIIGQLAGEEVNVLQHIVELKFSLMLTAGAEIYIQGNGSGIVTPSAINASTQSQYGASPLRPLKCGDVILFNQALGSFIRDFAFDFAIDGYRGNDITIFSSHLFEGYTLADWAYQKVPDSIIWAARSDGMLLSCTYVREQQVLAWARHDMQNGFVENVCCIPENGSYATYLVVRRVINGSTVRYMERMSQRIWQGPSAAVVAGTANSLGDPIDATYLDCYAGYDGRNTGSTTMTLAGLLEIVSGVNDYITFTDYNNQYYLALLPAGIYTVSTLASAVQTAINAQYNQSFTCTVVGGKLDIGPSTVPTLDAITLFPFNDPYAAQSAAVTMGYLLHAGYTVGSGSHAPAPNFPSPVSFQTDNTAYQQQLSLTASAAYFGSGYPAQIGDQIFLQDALWISSQGSKGTQLKCTIQAITSGTIATVTPESVVPAEFQAVAISLWARAVKTLSGLDYLEGQKVSVWADRYVVGSPLNYRIDQVYTVSSGTITLDKCYAVIYVGLPIIQDVETLDIETSFGETLLSKRKRVSRVAVYVYKTRSFFAGSEDPDHNLNNVNGDPLFQLYEEKLGGYQLTYDQPPPLITDQDYVGNLTRWNKNGRVFMRNLDPIPWTLLAVSAQFETGPQVPPYAVKPG